MEEAAHAAAELLTSVDSQLKRLPGTTGQKACLSVIPECMEGKPQSNFSGLFVRET